MVIIKQYEVLNEVIFSLRNADVISTTKRDVNRVTQEGSLDDVDEIVIPKSNVKNVVSVTIAGDLISNYSVDTDIDGECVITLPIAYSGEYEVVYDYGNDCIFIGYPRTDLSLKSFPRIAVEYIDIQSESGGFGNVNRNKHDLSVTVYASSKKEIREIIDNLREWCVTNQNNLKYLRLIKPVMIGPIVEAGEFIKFKDKIVKQNFDFAGLLQYDIN